VYFGELLTRTIFMAVILYIFGRLWSAVYAEAQAERIGGLTLAQMIWYLVITEAITVSTPRVCIEVDEDVRTGRLAVDLLRPFSYALQRLSHSLGERLVRFAVNFLAGAAVALVVVGPIQLTAAGLAMFAVVLPLAFVLEFLGYFAIGLGAFWLENTRGLMLLYSRANMILGGMLLPIEVFPEAMQPIVRALPFASIIYAPGRMFAAPSSELLADLLLRQGACVTFFSILVWLVQRKALRRLHTNGG
jgi:ABC-2 type transport system permease protein